MLIYAFLNLFFLGIYFLEFIFLELFVPEIDNAQPMWNVSRKWMAEVLSPGYNAVFHFNLTDDQVKFIEGGLQLENDANGPEDNANNPGLDIGQMNISRYDSYMDLIISPEKEAIPIYAAESHDVDRLANMYALYKDLTEDPKDEHHFIKYGKLAWYTKYQLGM